MHTVGAHLTAISPHARFHISVSLAVRACALPIALLFLCASPAAARVPSPPPTAQPTTTATATPVATSPVRAATTALLAAINKDRAKHHAPPLLLDATQSACSRKHSLHMESLGYISHDQFPSDVCIKGLWSGENVGEAYGTATSGALLLHRMMMSEGPCPHRGCPGRELAAHGHYINLINPQYRRVGIGLVVKGSAIWLTEDFVS